MYPIIRTRVSSAQLVSMLTVTPATDGFMYRVFVVDGQDKAIVELFVKGKFDRFV